MNSDEKLWERVGVLHRAGYSNAEIAKTLGLRKGTVHVMIQLMSKERSS